MPRINQLPSASSVAQTDVLAIDTPEKTYQVPRSVLAPAPYIATIPTGQWSGSGSDYYITVTASNVTADAMLYPFYDNASAALLNGPVWVIPAEGSFTIHTTAIPSGTVTISVLMAGIVGEAQYQVLSDVYSKSQVDTIVSQSTAVEDVSVGVSGVTVHKMGKLVQLTSAGTSVTASGAGWVDVFAIPNDIRPADANLYFSGVDNNASAYAASPAINLRINRSALKVQAYAYSDKLSFSPRFCVTYFTP